jgi:CRISPR-associated protein Cmr2
MTFEYIYHLVQEEIENPSSNEQWAGQYNRFVALGRKKEAAEPLRERWKNQYLQDGHPPGEKVADGHWQALLRLTPPPEILPALEALPFGSFSLHFKLCLQQPYLSKDDNDFHIIDNPLVREKVFRWPMVRPSGWKGSLRHALWQLGYGEKDEENDQIRRLFGETKSEDTGQAGRLYFYPTFFDRSGVEMINPHDREKRVGKNPILLECVSCGAEGTLTLLYVPFDQVGEAEKETRDQVTKDLQLVAQGIKAMMTEYGFGAKTSSGFGVAEDRLVGEGVLQLNILEPAPLTTTATAPPQLEPDLPRYLSAPGQLHLDFRTAEGGLKSEAEYRVLIESRGQKYGKKSKLLYDKAKSWWEREGSLSAERKREELEPEIREKPMLPRLTERKFDSFSQMAQKVEELAEALRQEGEK